MNIVIVGHIDHGKSTMIGRLLYDTNSIPEQKLEELKKTCEMLGRELEFAYITDALEEERRSQLTIDTTQTFFSSKKRDYAIIDVPGHKEFLKNMITGASQADVAILIVDAKEGMKEQTRRHAYVLKFLGIEQIVVAVNKMDLVNYDEHRFKELKKALLEYLNLMGVQPKEVIPISAHRGDNVVKRTDAMPWYNGKTVIETLDLFEETSRDYDFRFPIQDVYSVEGERVLVGNVTSGSLKKGDRVSAFPGIGTVTIKKIVTLEGELEIAKKPKSIGIVLNEGVTVDRGVVLCKGRDPLIVNKVEASVLCMLYELKVGGEYTFRCTTQEVPFRLSSIKDKLDVTNLEKLDAEGSIKETEIGKVILTFKRPVVVEKFSIMQELGRFVVEENGEIIAGGIVI
jgi:sulfate adenylyltransferase large subunit